MADEPNPNPKPPIAANSDAWVKLRKHLNGRIAEHHQMLETPGVELAHYQGRIAEIRDLMRLIEPDKPLEGTSSTYS